MERKSRIIATVINDLHHDQRMIRICSSLQKAGHEVELWGRRQHPYAPPSRSFRQSRMAIWPNSGPLFYMVYQFRLLVRLLTARYDIVHAVDLDTLLPATVAARLRGKRLVYDAHEYFTEVPELQGHSVKKKVWKWVERTALPHTDARITVGPELARLFETEYGLPFTVLMNAPASVSVTNLDADQNAADQAEEASDEPWILYQGALNEGRGLEALLEAMKDCDIQLRIAGDGPLRSRLEGLVRSKGLQDRVQFLGLIAPEDLPALTNQAFIGYNVSEERGLSYYYSLNNKFFDYIHAGIPALTNDFPEYRRLHGQHSCGILTVAKPEALRDCINLLLKDRPLYQNLKKNCLLASQVWNWEEEEKKLIALYDGLSD